MVENKWDNLWRTIKYTLSLKRTRVTLYIAAVLWLAVFTQMVVNRFFREEFQITEAFVKSDTNEMRSTLEVVAEYKAGILSKEDKREIIHFLADSIGLVIDDEIGVWEEDGRSEYFFYKQAKHATSEIKLISMEAEEDNIVTMKHYIIVRLNILQSISSIDKYKSLLEEALSKLETDNLQITLKYEGSREGNLTTEQKQEIAELLINELQGELVMEYDEGDLYTVYAYTGMLNEYIATMGTKINVQITVSYNELTNKTKIAMATPVMGDGW